MSLFCMGCGNSLSKDERYCGICGRDSQAQAAPVDPSVAFGLPPETSGKAIFSLVTGFLFFSALCDCFARVRIFVALRHSKKRRTAHRPGPGNYRNRAGISRSCLHLGLIGLAFMHRASEQREKHEGYRREFDCFLHAHA